MQLRNKANELSKSKHEIDNMANLLDLIKIKKNTEENDNYFQNLENKRRNKFMRKRKEERLRYKRDYSKT